MSFVDSYYLTPKWQDTYKDNIKPVNGDRMWEKTGKYPIQIPEKRRMPGHPKKYDRIKEAHEPSTNPTKVTRGGRTITCSNYKQIGHNIGTCKRAPMINTTPKRKRGRPRKTPVDPWSIENTPKRRRAQSQSTPVNFGGRGRGRGRPRGRGNHARGRGQPPIPRGYGCYIAPFFGEVFDVWGSRAVDMTGPPLQAPPPRAPSSSQAPPQAPSSSQAPARAPSSSQPPPRANSLPF
ncbi:basic salivary proline-rich protein 3-like [Eutrema salsugineum]|uniref:basic salivary proline-rich protein 3-like n=1 Tax=Eutrema salsugineum TaxID=72664 RepID=UPI000CED2A3B|nr:basic salivary proline-rich protein 3-like [Eutrema salsugineum]